MTHISFQPEFDNLILLGLWETSIIQYARINMEIDRRYSNIVGPFLWTTWSTPGSKTVIMSKRYIYLL